MKTIIFLDDDCSFHRTIHRIIIEEFEREQIEALPFSDADAALRHLLQNSNEICAFVTDLMLPGCDLLRRDDSGEYYGLEIIRFIRKTFPHITTIVLSAAHDDILDLARRSADLVFYKYEYIPFQINYLVKEISNAI